VFLRKSSYFAWWQRKCDFENDKEFVIG